MIKYLFPCALILLDVGLDLYAMVHLLEQYNKTHKTCYTYGQFLSLIHCGKISIVGMKECR